MIGESEIPRTTIKNVYGNNYDTILLSFKQIEEERPAVFPSSLGDLGCCHILIAWAGLGPRAEGTGQSGAASEPSLDLYCLVDPKLQIQAGPPIATASLQHPKTGGHSGVQELWKVNPFFISPRGVPTSASFLKVHPQTFGGTPSKAPFCGYADWWVKGEEAVVRRKGLRILCALCTLITTQEPNSLLRLWLLQRLKLGLKKCCHLVAVSGNNNWKTCA